MIGYYFIFRLPLLYQNYFSLSNRRGTTAATYREYWRQPRNATNNYTQPRAPSIFILSAASIYLTSAKLTLFYLSVLLAATMMNALAATFPPRAATYHSAGAATSSYTVARHLRASVRPSKPFFSIGPYSSLSIVSKIVFSVRFCAQKMLSATLLRRHKIGTLI